jgi:putative ABC transport system permease protein
MDLVKNIWENVTSGEEFNYSFLDESLKAQYQNDQNLGRIVSIATILSIIIGSLGLYGLASLTMQSRVREISIRKVLGASEKSILILLSKDFVYLNLISLLVSIPMTLYLMKSWLSTFEYHVSISWNVFAMAGGIALVVASITISHQALKAAWTQPAETLKHE